MKKKHMALKEYIRSKPFEVQKAFKAERNRLEIKHWKSEARVFKKVCELMTIELRGKLLSCSEFCNPPYVPVGGHVCNDAHCHKSIITHFLVKAGDRG